MQKFLIIAKLPPLLEPNKTFDSSPPECRPVQLVKFHGNSSVCEAVFLRDPL
jgi:hypothetical protein